MANFLREGPPGGGRAPQGCQSTGIPAGGRWLLQLAVTRDGTDKPISPKPQGRISPTKTIPAIQHWTIILELNLTYIECIKKCHGIPGRALRGAVGAAVDRSHQTQNPQRAPPCSIPPRCTLLPTLFLPPGMDGKLIPTLGCVENPQRPAGGADSCSLCPHQDGVRDRVDLGWWEGESSSTWTTCN